MRNKVLDTVIGGIIRNIPGGLGQRIRAAYWRRRFRACGRVRIDEGVIFHNPEQIKIGDSVWIMAYSILTAPVPRLRPSGAVRNSQGSVDEFLTIGDEVQVGAYNILNGTGGLTIGDCATLSGRVSIYSATHLPRNPDDPSMAVGCNGMVRHLPVFSKLRPVTIGSGAWLGLHTAVICCNVGEHAFVTSGTILVRDLAPETQALPDGTTRHRYRRKTAS